ncbi:MAG: FtsX-like permease family protein [Chloroflexi bacterium]|nr:FtsX-like permease family protein [Chloroflexota bacterium]
MRIAYRKVVRDLWSNKARTALVVLSIGVGVMAVGMIFSSNTLMEQRMTQAQIASSPSNVWLFLRGQIDDDGVASIERLPEVQAAQGRAERGVIWKASPENEWGDATIVAIEDYQSQIFDLLELRVGSWPGANSVLVEWNHVEPYGIPGLGEPIYFEINGQARAFTLAGILRDPSVAAPPFVEEPSFYVTREVMSRMAGSRNFDQLRFSIPNYTEEEAERVSEIVEDKLELQGIGVGFSLVRDPTRHWAQDIMDGIGLILTVMAVAALFLSAILVINTINAVIAQQIPQIGIMKTVGGVRRQISQLYLAGVAVYSLLALALAIPLGALGGYALAGYILGVLNVPVLNFEFASTSIRIQLAAGLLVPLIAALWPILRGVGISVSDAIRRYGVGSGRYGMSRVDRVLANIRGLPSMVTLSLRNTFRRMGRVTLTLAVLIMAGAVFMMVLTTHYSFTQAIAEIWDGLGFDTFVVFEDLERIDEVESVIEGHPNVERVEMGVSQGAGARVPGDTSPGSDQRITLQGIPRDTQMYTPKLTAGRNLDPGDGHALLLNQKLAKDLGLTLGDQIEIDLGDAGTSNWTIVGLIFDITNDQSTAYMHVDTLNEELHQVGRASIARIVSRDSTRAAQDALLSDLELMFEARGTDLAFVRASVEDQERAEAQFGILTTILMTMTVVMAAVGSIGLSGTLSINVIERRREIGVMRAVGASSRDVGLIMIMEGLLLGLASWAIAVPISILVGRPFVNTIGAIIEFPGPYQLSVSGLWIWLLIVVVLSLVASWLPANRASQVSVNESLAYE